MIQYSNDRFHSHLHHQSLNDYNQKLTIGSRQSGGVEGELPTFSQSNYLSNYVYPIKLSLFYRTMSIKLSLFYRTMNALQIE